VRLNRYLAASGTASRRTCDDLIAAGEVQVNGLTVTEPWYDVNTDSDRVEVSGAVVSLPETPRYILVHKPAGTITTVTDTHGRPTVLALVQEKAAGRRLYPVGRLDADTTGALLLTDDGDLTHRLTHPSFESRKEYLVRLDRPLSARERELLAAGIELEDGPVKPDEITLTDTGTVRLVLHEGRKRIVKRLFAALGITVTGLHRSRFAGLSADDLPVGGSRELSGDEADALRRSVGLEPLRKDS